LMGESQAINTYFKDRRPGFYARLVKD
jgi:hypothetical protein